MPQTTEARKQPTCKQRVRVHLEDRLGDLRKLWARYNAGTEEDDPDLGNLNEYGLSFDYVAAGTFTDQREGYFRYQLSWGGPSDEFRFFTDATLRVTRIEYWFLDWFDGAKITLKGKDEELMLELWSWFEEMGSVQAMLQKAEERD